MPMLVEHIDAIARKKQRDVLYLTFHHRKQDPMRDTVCKWLTEHHIEWQPCGHFADESSMCSYRGQIYLDVPYDDNNSSYVLVRDYLENPDGTMRFETVGFWYLTLEKAMENAHHDEPGFWEKWADGF